MKTIFLLLPLLLLASCKRKHPRYHSDVQIYAIENCEQTSLTCIKYFNEVQRRWTLCPKSFEREVYAQACHRFLGRMEENKKLLSSDPTPPPEPEPKSAKESIKELLNE